jgi:hypothetical protein
LAQFVRSVTIRASEVFGPSAGSPQLKKGRSRHTEPGADRTRTGRSRHPCPGADRDQGEPVFVYSCESCNIKLYRWTPTPRACPGCASPLREQPVTGPPKLPSAARLARTPGKSARPPATA